MSKQSENGETTSPQERPTTRDLDQEQARLAYSIIQSLLEHTRIISDLIALMAQVLDEANQLCNIIGQSVVTAKGSKKPSD